MNLCDHPVKDVLDIGTGSGILALMLAQRFPTAHVHAVELEPDVASKCTKTPRAVLSRPNHGAPACVSRMGGSVDLAVCNPPFFGSP